MFQLSELRDCEAEGIAPGDCYPAAALLPIAEDVLLRRRYCTLRDQPSDATVAQLVPSVRHLIADGVPGRMPMIRDALSRDWEGAAGAETDDNMLTLTWIHAVREEFPDPERANIEELVAFVRQVIVDGYVFPRPDGAAHSPVWCDSLEADIVQEWARVNLGLHIQTIFPNTRMHQVAEEIRRAEVLGASQVAFVRNLAAAHYVAVSDATGQSVFLIEDVLDSPEVARVQTPPDSHASETVARHMQELFDAEDALSLLREQERVQAEWAEWDEQRRIQDQIRDDRHLAEALA